MTGNSFLSVKLSQIPVVICYTLTLVKPQADSELIKNVTIKNSGKCKFNKETPREEMGKLYTAKLPQQMSTESNYAVRNELKEICL